METRNEVQKHVDVCVEQIRAAFEQLYDTTGLTVKVVEIGRHGKLMGINAAIGVETAATSTAQHFWEVTADGVELETGISD